MVKIITTALGLIAVRFLVFLWR